MKAVRELLSRIRGALGSRHRDSTLDHEMHHHLEMLAEEHERRGLSKNEARQAALRDFGSVEQIAEAYRDQRGLPFIDTLILDVVHAFRMWGRSPGFTAVV